MEFKRRDGMPTRLTDYSDVDSDAGDGEVATAPTTAGEGDQRKGDVAAAQPSETIIETTASFDGTFSTEQDLRVRGKISGEVSCKGRFIVERDATANARIDARDAEIHGEVTGDLVCSGRLQLSRSAVVRGTIRAGALIVEEGATVSGSVETVSASAPQESGIVTRPARAAQPTPTEAEAAPPRARREVPSFALVQSDDPVTVPHR